MEKRRNSSMKFIFIGIYLILTISGLILMKLGGNSGTIAVANKELTFGISLISALGFICYIASFILYTKIIMMFDLSYIVPITTGIAQILTLVASSFILKEEISIKGIIGACIIIAGIIIMNWKSN